MSNGHVTYFPGSNLVSSFWVAEWFALSTLDNKVLGLNPAGHGIQHMSIVHFIAHSLSLSSVHCLSMTSIMLNGHVSSSSSSSSSSYTLYIFFFCYFFEDN